jgi:CBS domain-containing protein
MEHTARLLLREVVTVGPSEPVRDVVRLMKAKHVGCVLVVDGGRLTGIFSERDLVMRVAIQDEDLRGAPVSRFMTPDPVVVDAGEPLEKVFQILSRRRFRHVPIVENGRPAGIVSLSDFAGILPEVFSEEKYAQYFVDYWRSRG